MLTFSFFTSYLSLYFSSLFRLFSSLFFIDVGDLAGGKGKGKDAMVEVKAAASGAAMGKTNSLLTSTATAYAVPTGTTGSSTITGSITTASNSSASYQGAGTIQSAEDRSLARAERGTMLTRDAVLAAQRSLADGPNGSVEGEGVNDVLDDDEKNKGPENVCCFIPAFLLSFFFSLLVCLLSFLAFLPSFFSVLSRFLLFLVLFSFSPFLICFSLSCFSLARVVYSVDVWPRSPSSSILPSKAASSNRTS